MNKLVTIPNGQPVTNSLLVAEKFEKRHSDVLDSIRNLVIMETKYFETRTVLVNPDKPDTKIVIYKTYQARSKFEAVGKTIRKLLPGYAGHYLKAVSASHTRQKPLM